MDKQKKDIEKFLESERSHSKIQSTSGSSSALSDLIKCFCGKCEEKFFKRSTVKEALKSNGEQLLSNSDSREIFKKFLDYQKEEDDVLEGEVEKIIWWFQLAKKVIDRTCDFQEIYTHRHELALVFEMSFHDEINKAQNGRSDQEEFCKELMKQCAVKLELSDEFDEFKNELKKKLGISGN